MSSSFFPLIVIVKPVGGENYLQYVEAPDQMEVDIDVIILRTRATWDDWELASNCFKVGRELGKSQK